MLGYNLFLYCGNNPIRFSDDEGTFWDIAIDVVFTIGSIINVIQNPTSGKAWAALGLDLICVVVPFVSGAGTVVRAASKVDDVVDAGRAVNQVDNIVDAGRTTENVGSVADVAACFIEGTQVLTDEGKKNIEDIQAGDKVYAENPETGDKGLKKVVQTFVNETDELIHISLSEETISTTPEHPFYVKNAGWIGAGDLKAGDILVLQSGGYVIVEKTEHELLEKPISVYNFEVEDYHTYYVGSSSVLVHNTCYVKGSLPEDGITLNSTDALTLADNFLGKNYSEPSPGRFVSSDGFRQVRMTSSDLATVRNHAGAPHLNFETLAKNPLKQNKLMITGNAHVFIFD